MLLTNKSETVLFGGITPKAYGLLAEFALLTPGAPKQLVLYQVPIKEDSKPMGTYTIEKVSSAASSVFLNIPLKEAQNGTSS